MDKPYTFAQRLTEIMRMRNLRKTELANMCGISRSNITRYCNGEYEAKQDVVYAMASRLHVDAAWLMGYDVPMAPGSSGQGQLMDDKLDTLISLFRQMSPEVQDLILAQAEATVQSQKHRGDS